MQTRGQRRFPRLNLLCPFARPSCSVSDLVRGCCCAMAPTVLLPLHVPASLGSLSSLSSDSDDSDDGKAASKRKTSPAALKPPPKAAVTPLSKPPTAAKPPVAVLAGGSKPSSVLAARLPAAAAAAGSGAGLGGGGGSSSAVVRVSAGAAAGGGASGSVRSVPTAVNFRDTTRGLDANAVLRKVSGAGSGEGGGAVGAIQPCGMGRMKGTQAALSSLACLTAVGTGVAFQQNAVARFGR